ncbi:MAG: hypothetical protein FD123_1122 [Bacteroidetes bacterium]|nr:MAG: hypothetical protein FD123_1122 [Bacteroidota bacterium]
MKQEAYLKPSLQKRQKRRDKRLAEEVIECYRTGRRLKSVKGSKRSISGKNFGNGPAKEGIKRMHKGGTKNFNDTLGPLVRYLRTQTGKNWNNVFSELSKKLDSNTVSGQHVIDHLWGFVNLHVKVKSKKEIYVINRRGWQAGRLYSQGKWPEFYVHPKTGILLEAPKGKWTINGPLIF